MVDCQEFCMTVLQHQIHRMITSRENRHNVLIAVVGAQIKYVHFSQWGSETDTIHQTICYLLCRSQYKAFLKRNYPSTLTDD